MHIAFPMAAEEQQPLLLPAAYDIFWSAVVFVIVLVFFVWRVLPKLNEVLDKRADAIEGGIKRAEEAEAKAAAALESHEAQLAEARAEAAQIRERARTEGQQILADLKQQAQDEADRIAAQGQQRIEADRQAALVQLKSEVGTIALDLSEKVVGESIDDVRARGLVDRFLADLAASETSR